MYQGECHECDMKDQVVQNKEELLIKKDQDLELLERKVKKSEEKKRNWRKQSDN